MANNLETQFNVEGENEPAEKSEISLVGLTTEGDRVGQQSSDRVDEMEPLVGMKAPAGWQKEIDERGIDRNARSVNYYPPDGSDTVLSLFDRGHPVVGPGGNDFREILSKAPHPLTAEELETMSDQVLGNLADSSAFKISRAETRDLNGQKALVVEGEWLTSNKKFNGYFVPGENNHIRELYLEGVDPSFSRHFTEAVTAINTARWQPTNPKDAT